MPVGDVMRQFLIVANEQLDPELVERIRHVVGDSDALLHLVVPGGRGRLASGENRDAERRLLQALAALEVLDSVVVPEIGGSDPLESIGAVIERHEIDEIIICTPPSWLLRMVNLDLPSQVSYHFELPITHISRGMTDRWVYRASSPRRSRR